jgi:two-component system response regulator FixJ
MFTTEVALLEAALAEGLPSPCVGDRPELLSVPDLGTVYVLGRGGLDLGATIVPLTNAGFLVTPLRDPSACLNLVSTRLPSAVVVDVGDRRSEGLDVLRCLRAWQCPTPCIVALPSNDVRTAVEAMKIGARDVIELPARTQDVVECVREVVGGSSLPPRPETVALSQFPGHDVLTRRELQVLSYVAAGSSNKEAGRLLGISPRTVEVHRARAMEKLGARNAADLVRIILSEG